MMPRMSFAALVLAVNLAAAGADVPAGTEIQIRLRSKVASNSSKAQDVVEALVVAPLMLDGRVVVPAGSNVAGQVKGVKAASETDRATLELSFTNLVVGASKIMMTATVAGIDNARESVDANGQIQGILASETLSTRIDQGITKLAQKYSGLADLLQGAKSAVVKETVADIDFEPGVEMTLKLTAPLKIPENAIREAAGSKLEPVTDESQLIALVTGQPFQTVAVKPPLPSDVTNLMFIGTQEQLTGAFSEAGWSTAATLSSQSKVETARAIIEDRGYKEAPVSVLMLDGRPPDLVFEKQNDTFAQRHHLRIWRRPETFHEQPVWVCAATHDTGISFSEKDRTFIHKIDPQIDRERAKVVNDLLLTGKVKSLELVERPAVPQHGHNATGDNLETDASMAVLIF